ncbi:hypothetical protein [Nostoc sp.]
MENKIFLTRVHLWRSVGAASRREVKAGFACVEAVSNRFIYL